MSMPVRKYCKKIHAYIRLLTHTSSRESRCMSHRELTAYLEQLLFTDSKIEIPAPKDLSIPASPCTPKQWLNLPMSMIVVPMSSLVILLGWGTSHIMNS